MDRNQIASYFRLRSGTIFIEFTSTGPGSDRDAVFRSKTKLRGSGIFISESLTPRRHHLFRTLLEMKRAGKIAAVYTQTGDIIIRKGAGSRPRGLAAADRIRAATAGTSAEARPGPDNRIERAEIAPAPDSPVCQRWTSSSETGLPSPTRSLTSPLRRDAAAPPATAAAHRANSGS